MRKQVERIIEKFLKSINWKVLTFCVKFLIFVLLIKKTRIGNSFLCSCSTISKLSFVFIHWKVHWLEFFFSEANYLQKSVILMNKSEIKRKQERKKEENYVHADVHRLHWFVKFSSSFKLIKKLYYIESRESFKWEDLRTDYFVPLVFLS